MQQAKHLWFFETAVLNLGCFSITLNLHSILVTLMVIGERTIPRKLKQTLHYMTLKSILHALFDQGFLHGEAWRKCLST